MFKTKTKLETKRKATLDLNKNVKKVERKFKDVLVAAEEDKKVLTKTQQEYESDQIKRNLFNITCMYLYKPLVRKMKVEFEEIEAQFTAFKSKSRKMASDLLDIEERADHAEQTLDVIWGK